MPGLWVNQGQAGLILVNVKRNSVRAERPTIRPDSPLPAATACYLSGMPDGNAGGLVCGQAACVTWHDQRQVVAIAGVLVVLARRECEVQYLSACCRQSRVNELC